MSGLVSVVMPAYNVAPFLVESVGALRAQTYTAIELVAVDDGSQDGTGEMLDRLAAGWADEGRRMIVVHQSHAGAAAARNSGLARARGEFVCLLDADDRMAPSLVERLVALLRADSGAVLAAPIWRYIDDAGRPTGIVSDPGGLRHDAAGLVVAGPLHSATGVMVRAEAAREAGPFDVDLRGYIDLDWFVRVIAGRGVAAAMVPEPLADYRKRAGQITADWRRMQRNWEQVLAKMAATDHGLSPFQESRARSRNQIYWATLAYQAGDYAAARRLVAASWRRDPRYAFSDRLSRIRTLAALASLLPRPLHDAIRVRAGERRVRRTRDLPDAAQVAAPRDGPAEPLDGAAESRLRIGLLTHGFPVYSETFVTTLAAELLAAGHDLRILATDPAPPKDPVLALAGHDRLAPLITRARQDGRLPPAQAIDLVRHAPGRAPLLAGLAVADRLAPRRLAVTRLLASEAPFDVVHAQFGFLGLTAMRHRRWGTLRTRALVVHLRGYDITRYVEERGRRVYDRLFREADLFIANCGFFRDRAVALGCPPDKIVVIGSPIDTGRFVPPDCREPAGGREVRLVAVGRLVEKKGFADAIEALALLAGEGRDVRLDILGDGECRADLEARIARARLGGRVTLHGVASQSQVIAALHRADIALAPSVTAASGDADAPVNTAKEAMATGLPVVATRHGGIPELVIPDENGDLVPERDPAALAAAIAQMMDDPPRREALGRSGRLKVVTEFGHRHILQRTLEAYRTALTRAGEKV